jgi:long-chain acyl-CoA synthetase
MTQPLGGGKVVDYTWAQAMDQARRMATHLQGRGLSPARALPSCPRTARIS